MLTGAKKLSAAENIYAGRVLRDFLRLQRESRYGDLDKAAERQWKEQD